MIDYLALALTHGLIFVTLLRILFREELDHEAPSAMEPPAEARLSGAADRSRRAAPRPGRRAPQKRKAPRDA